MCKYLLWLKMICFLWHQETRLAYRPVWPWSSVHLMCKFVFFWIDQCWPINYYSQIIKYLYKFQLSILQFYYKIRIRLMSLCCLFVLRECLTKSSYILIVLFFQFKWYQKEPYTVLITRQKGNIIFINTYYSWYFVNFLKVPCRCSSCL